MARRWFCDECAQETELIYTCGTRYEQCASRREGKGEWGGCIVTASRYRELCQTCRLRWMETHKLLQTDFH